MNQIPNLGKQGPAWTSVVRRRVIDRDSSDVLHDESIQPQLGKKHYAHKLPEHVLHIQTEFTFRPQERSQTMEALSVHQVRQVSSQVKEAAQRPSTKVDGKRFMVAEVFNPPRFAPFVEEVEGTCRSYDLKTGFDFLKEGTGEYVKDFLQDNPPDLLVASPPCTNEGGWFHLNASKWSAAERLRRVRICRTFVKFAVELLRSRFAPVANSESNGPHVVDASDCFASMDTATWRHQRSLFGGWAFIDSKYKPLYARQPPGGIPGVPSDAALEVLGNIYGQNDAPLAWYRTFHDEALRIGRLQLRSKFDPCLYYLRSPETNQLQGILEVHVDDTCLGGIGPQFESAVKQLRARFPYRKWRVAEGELCGSYYVQEPRNPYVPETVR